MTEHITVPKGHVLRTKADVQRLSNLMVTSVSYRYDTIVRHDENDESYCDKDPKSKRARSYKTWDGISYESGYGGNRFCKMSCAERFAQAAHKAGYRMQ